ncbi:MAG: class I SAM-dependent methyltransferase, partial [Bacteroidales bacterium]|nr:class I SAM-dependent methyltransferase [Bacteroidales bacterium]
MTTTQKFLKGIHNFIYKFGIDLSLVKKEEQIDAIEYNSIENMDKYWQDQEKKQVWDSSEYKEFYTLLINELKKKGLKLDNTDWSDVGCGSGTLLLFLKKIFTPKSISGFEVSQSAIEISKKRIPEGNFKVYNLYEEPIEQFDFI